MALRFAKNDRLLANTSNKKFLNIKDHNKNVLKSANKKLLKICLIIFFSSAIMDALIFKGNPIVMQIILWLIIIGYVATRVNMSNKVKVNNANNIKMHK